MLKISRRDFLAGVAGAIITVPYARAATPEENLGSSEYVRYTVLDPQTNKVLVARDAGFVSHPASLTKLMTAKRVMLAIDDPETYFNLNTLVLVPDLIKNLPSDAAVVEELETPGLLVPVRDLLVAMGSRSCAISSLALATHLGLDETKNLIASEQKGLNQFILSMNEEAQNIGMSSSLFSNVTGLPHDNHYSTATDIALLMNDLQTNHPALMELACGHSSSDLESTSSHIIHTSRLLQERHEATWAKTGLTNEAGWCIGVHYQKEGVPLIAVILAESSREAREKTTLNILTKAYTDLGVYAGTYEKPNNAAPSVTI